MYLKKTLPLEKVMNRMIALAVSHRKTAENILNSKEKFSSTDVVDNLVSKYEARASEMELFAQTVMNFQRGIDSNHIFHYHEKLADCDERALHASLVEELSR